MHFFPVNAADSIHSLSIHSLRSRVALIIGLCFMMPTLSDASGTVNFPARYGNETAYMNALSQHIVRVERGTIYAEHRWICRRCRAHFASNGILVYITDGRGQRVTASIKGRMIIEKHPLLYWQAHRPGPHDSPPSYRRKFLKLYYSPSGNMLTTERY